MTVARKCPYRATDCEDVAIELQDAKGQLSATQALLSEARELLEIYVGLDWYKGSTVYLNATAFLTKTATGVDT